MFTAVASPQLGEIGLGTISGSVGEIRSYEEVTVSQGGAGGSLIRRASGGDETGARGYLLTSVLSGSFIAFFGLAVLFF